ncbi:MAG: undecaprenyl-diphosphatase UppP [Ardenticatenaceae bacterium]|nr:undecaprenyl-diphosphatase UppP [Ardenticatenaceae bacterium]
MNLIEAIILGIVQGATEFLPVSSSGHLVLVPFLFGMSQPTLSFIAIMHLGTLTAVLIYFYRDLLKIMQAVWDGVRQAAPLATTESRLGWFIVAGSIPAAVAGLTLSDFFDTAFGSPTIVAVLLLVTAVILIIGERLMTGSKSLSQMTWKDAWVIGFLQMIALLPGVSRSGSTLMAGLKSGFNREDAARYSFLLGIPAIVGAGMLGILDVVQANQLATQLPFFLVGFLIAAITGYLCIHFLLNWLKSHNLYVFAGYCAAFGVFNLVLAWLK